MTRIMLALSLLTLLPAAWANRTLVIVEHAVEAELSHVMMPSGPIGTVLVTRHCAGCEPWTLQATNETLWMLGDTVVPYQEFVLQMERERLSGPGRSTMLAVFYLPDSSRITRIGLVGAAAGG